MNRQTMKRFRWCKATRCDKENILNTPLGSFDDAKNLEHHVYTLMSWFEMNVHAVDKGTRFGCKHAGCWCTNSQYLDDQHDQNVNRNKRKIFTALEGGHWQTRCKNSLCSNVHMFLYFSSTDARTRVAGWWSHTICCRGRETRQGRRQCAWRKPRAETQDHVRQSTEGISQLCADYCCAAAADLRWAKDRCLRPQEEDV